MSAEKGGSGFNPILNSLELMLHSFKHKVKLTQLAAYYASHDLRYRSKVDKETNQAAAEHLTTFTGEMLAFLNQNPSSILKPINPTDDETKSVRELLESAGNNSLTSVSSRGKVAHSGAPYLIHTFVTNEITRADVRIMKPKIRTGLATTWDVNNDKLLRLSIDCHKGFVITGIFDFIALEKKAESPDDVVDILGEKISGEKTKINVFLDGARIDRETVFDLNGKCYEHVDQFYLLGCFDGEASKKTYWIYGCNSVNSHEKVTSKKEASALETVGNFQIQ